MNKPRTTIFNQLIYNVVVPAMIALITLGVIIYQNQKKIMIKNSKDKNEMLVVKFKDNLELQDMALEIIETSLDQRMERLSSELTTKYFANTQNIERADLNKIRKSLGMDNKMEDLYIIDANGIIVNTTFEKDRGLNLFSFGEEHQKYLKHVIAGGKFVSERFAIENSTKQLKKYTYQPTLDGKYIIEVGAYSQKANEVVALIKEKISASSQGGETEVDLFIITDKPFSLGSNTSLSDAEKPLVDSVCSTKAQVSQRKEIDKRVCDIDYVFMPRKSTGLYKGSVIKIVSDRTADVKVLRNQLIKLFAIFGLTILIVVVMLYQKTKVITNPIKNLVDSVNRITNGHFNERAEIIGNNEIATLSEQFNQMIEELESLYNDLEQKVKDRTAEIMKQKEEIEGQRNAIELQKNMLEEVNKHLGKAYDEITEQKKHITDSIVYAKRIQTAILPPDDLVHRHLPDSFILYKPKDIVSGDFYWLTEKDGIVMVAAVDCTGHGVPGAFMSIVGYNNLNHAVNFKGARAASDILDQLNQGVTDTLRTQERHEIVKDGMDLALCCFDFKNGKVQYAGANNPLVVIKNDSTEVTFDPTKAPIGAYWGKEPTVFKNNEYAIETGDCYYIFSDGYADQFGGPDGRKFMKRKLKELLQSIHKLPMAEQREMLNKTIESWKGESEQVDDILVIGIRV